MIASLTGTITHKEDRFLVIEVAGIGYKVYSTSEILREHAIGTSIRVWTHQVIREDTNDLYGFTDQAELDLFELIIGVSGVGPRSALAIVSLAPPNTLKKAIASGNIEYLTKVSGIGRKISEKIILELRDKIELLPDDGDESNMAEEADVIEALKAIGYKEREAREVLRKVPSTITSTEEKIKEALKILGQK
jgi:Holliday junction DNA helicase RuvA